MQESSLYRAEAIAYQSNEKLGAIVVLPKPIHRLASLILIGVLLGGLILLANQTYTNKISVDGWLINPNQAISVNHYEPSGLVNEVLVKNGDYVHQGDELLLVKRSQSLLAGSRHQDSHNALVQSKLDQVESEHQRSLKDLSLQAQRLEQEKVYLHKQQDLITEREKLINKRANTALINLQNARRLRQQDYISQAELNRLEDLVNDSNIKASQNTLDAASTHDELKRVAHSLDKLALEKQRLTQGYKTEKLNLLLQKEDIKLSAAYTIRAPSSGYVSSLQVYKGTDLSKQKTLLKIVQDKISLEAKLYIPAHAIGLVKEAQGISIRLDAFPYQQFGKVQGQIIELGTSILMPDEISQSPILINQALFEANAKLDKNTINIAGKPTHFKHGMTFKASIQLEDRNLIQWILAPIYRLKGAL